MTLATRHRRHTIAVLAMAALVTSLVSSAGASPAPRGRHAAGLFKGLAALDLTQEQRTAIREILRSQRPAFRSVVERVREARAELRNAVSADPIDESLIRQKVQDLSRVGVDAALFRARIGAKIRAVLTDEQRKKVAELRERRTTRARARSAAAKAYFDVLMEE